MSRADRAGLNMRRDDGVQTAASSVSASVRAGVCSLSRGYSERMVVRRIRGR
jgi:hypothetical protein